MSSFLYFVPNGPQVLSRDHLRSLGFEHADVAGLPGCGCSAGPGGESGCTFALTSPAAVCGNSPRVGYYTSKDDPNENPQTWLETMGGKMWVGWENAHPPKPVDLQRQIPVGRAVTLADGNVWVVPVLRDVIGKTTLPTTMGVDARGNAVQNKVLPEFHRAWKLTQMLFAASKGFDPALISDEETWELACIALGMNYYVSTWEVSALGMITTENLQLILGAVIDIPEELFEA